MPLPGLDSTQTADAIDLYATGLSCQDVALTMGVGIDSVYGALVRAGIERRSLSDARRGMFARKYADRDSIILSRYQAGESMNAIAADLGTQRRIVSKVLRQNNIKLRSVTESVRLLDRDVLTERGSQGCQNNRARLGWGEELVEAALIDRGEHPVLQQSVGTKNIDIAIHPVAVEVWLSSSFPTRDDYCRKRIEYLADRGWWVFYVFVSRRTKLLDVDLVADQAVDFRELAQGDPSSLREHRVIRGSGELVARCRDDLEHLPLVPSLVDGGDIGSVDDG